ncbi:hypothetical protein F2P81_013651 [Scophthalmus maximus]|uniref:Uncharacterized protein n=1 Tax=Scophthalmus maximus TaxID=52904 RepID=A0A6A4SM40_SCOMX|nr:hypothetical protein F2P81_013651 [Scophthalmus maximus]
MSKVQCFKEFVNERLTAAAEQIFRYLEETVAKYEEEIDRQRRLLDLIWKPEIRLRRAVVHEQRELPQQDVCKEGVLSEQQLCDQERNSSLDPEEPEPPQMKEEQEEPVSGQEGD